MKDVEISMKKLLFFFLIGCASCSLFDGMRKNSFVYADGQTLPLVVPKGFRKANVQTDAAGNRIEVFSYAGGGTLYFYYGDTIKEYQPIDTSMHIGKFYPENVLFYKGQDNRNGLFWRESRFRNFRFGYKNVSANREGWFDSSVNYAARQITRR